MSIRLLPFRASSLAVAIAACIAACIATASLARAQTPRMSGMAGMAGMHHDAPTPLSATARAQIAAVEAGARPLATTAAAAAAGFHPVFGWIPTMGVHWVDMARMSKEKQQDRAAPANLMFSTIAGKDSLVGAAFAYLTPESDSTPPTLFDGNPPWHEHPDLAPPGMRLVMLHVWFVPSPDGPFAGTNPNLPFWAAGLAAPDSARMHDAAFSTMVRKASLAIAEVVDSASLFPHLAPRPAIAPQLAARRDSVRALVADLRSAQAAKNTARWDRAAAGLASQWDGMYDAFLSVARTSAVHQRVEQVAAMLLGHHEGM